MNKDLLKLIKIWSAAILLGLLLMLGVKAIDGDTNRLGTISFQLEE